jgi:hypothetical protein
VSEADSEDRYLSGKVTDHIKGDASLVWRARPRRDHDFSWGHALDLLRRDLIVAAHLHFFPCLANVLNEVEGEGVVIVEDENHEKLLA